MNTKIRSKLLLVIFRHITEYFKLLPEIIKLGLAIKYTKTHQPCNAADNCENALKYPANIKVLNSQEFANTDLLFWN